MSWIELVVATIFMGLLFCIVVPRSERWVFVLFWLIKLLATLIIFYYILLHGGEGDFFALSNSYDPVRFWHAAQELEKTGKVTEGVNAQGIVSLWHFLQNCFFTKDPVVALLFNNLVGFFAISLFLIALKKIWLVGYFEWRSVAFIVILIPEILWYDAMPSRESLLVAMLALVLLPVMCREKLTVTPAVLGVLGIIGIWYLRRAMVLPVVGFLLFAFLMGAVQFKSARGRAMVLQCIVGLIILLYEQIFFKNSILGISDIGNNIAVSTHWQSGSLGKLIFPHNIFESIIYTPIRLVGYLIAPLLQFSTEIASRLNVGEWRAWQWVISVLTSVALVLAAPFAVFAVIESLRKRRDNFEIAALAVFLLVLIFSIAGGNIIIHERYRVMMLPFYFAVSAIGFNQFHKAYDLEASTGKWRSSQKLFWVASYCWLISILGLIIYVHFVR